MSSVIQDKVIVISAGGTGGHIFPAISVAGKLIEMGYSVLFVTDSSFELYAGNFKEVINNAKFSIKYLNVKRRRSFIKTAFEITIDVFSLIRLFIKKRVSAVVGFGSYVSFSSIVAGFLTFKKTGLIVPPTRAIDFGNTSPNKKIIVDMTKVLIKMVTDPLILYFDVTFINITVPNEAAILLKTLFPNKNILNTLSFSERSSFIKKI
ncbi:glycosyltransferase [Rickettsiales bacterium]|nr:glycosyltransferase [Rickettsiales bacterium]